MFSNGLLPGSAHREFMRQLRCDCKDVIEYHLRLADRSKVPRQADFNDVYSSYNKRLCGTEILKSMNAKIEDRIAALKEKDENYSICLQEFDQMLDRPFILTIFTPMMKKNS